MPSITPRGHTCQMWSYLTHVVTLATYSHMSHAFTFVTCGHNCHIRSQLSHTWSQLSHIVTIVTIVLNCHICHIWSQTVTIVTYGHLNFHLSFSSSSSSSPKRHVDLTAPLTVKIGRSWGAPLKGAQGQCTSVCPSLRCEPVQALRSDLAETFWVRWTRCLRCLSRELA